MSIENLGWTMRYEQVHHMTDRELMDQAREVAQCRSYYAYMSGATNLSDYTEKFDESESKYTNLCKELRARNIIMI